MIFDSPIILVYWKSKTQQISSLPLRFRVTKVEHKSNQKERRSLMSVSGTESVNGEVPVTPVKRERSDTE